MVFIKQHVRVSMNLFLAGSVLSRVLIIVQISQCYCDRMHCVSCVSNEKDNVNVNII